MSKITTCNMCGKELGQVDVSEEFSIYTTMGYGTNYDGKELNLDLCCSCMEEIINNCKISPFKEYPYISAGEWQ